MQHLCKFKIHSWHHLIYISFHYYKDHNVSMAFLLTFGRKSNTWQCGWTSLHLHCGNLILNTALLHLPLHHHLPGNLLRTADNNLRGLPTAKDVCSLQSKAPSLTYISITDEKTYSENTTLKLLLPANWSEDLPFNPNRTVAVEEQAFRHRGAGSVWSPPATWGLFGVPPAWLIQHCLLARKPEISQLVVLCVMLRLWGRSMLF